MRFGSMGDSANNGKNKKPKNNKKEAMKRERKLADRLNGRATPGSGAIDGMKGDITTDSFLIEDKFTATPSYTVKKQEIDKISREARECSKEPLFSIAYIKGVPNKTPAEWALIPERICDLKPFDEFLIKNKTRILPITTLSGLYTRSLKADKLPIAKVEFFKRTLGVDSVWLLLPLTLLEDEGYFD